jgi:twinkle protein
MCAKDRKKKSERTLSVTVDHDGTKYFCHHCGISGVKVEEPFYEKYIEEKPKQVESVVRAISVPKNTDDSLIESALHARGIDYSKVKDKFNIVSGNKYFRQSGDLPAGEVPAIGFVYGANEAVKWRSVECKRFTQDGAARSLWGIEAARELEEIDSLVITEGELDALAVACSMDTLVTSVPNGAPQRISNREIDPEEDTKFSYIWNAKDVIKQCKKIILVTDNDEAGKALQEELARRIGRAKCYSVTYPEDCKDANDVLRTYGEDAVKALIQSAEPMPLEGVYTVDDYKVDVKHLYNNGMMGGLSTGIPSVDELFTIKQGQVSIVTGVPGSGKSEFIDQLMVNLAKQYDWKFAVASFENPPPLHIAKLAEKIVGKPFFDGLTPRMTQQEADDVLDYIHDHWMFLEQRSGEAATMDSVLDRAQQAVMRMGVRGLVIDPYNYIAQSQKVENEHQGINEMLTRLVSFARANGIHIWFIAHPSKMPTDQDGKTAVPKGMNISGSAAFFAKADLGVTVHQNKNKEVEIHCWKVRFKWLGKVGKTTLDYDVPTGRYSEVKYDIHMPESIKPFQDKDDDWF